MQIVRRVRLSGSDFMRLQSDGTDYGHRGERVQSCRSGYKPHRSAYEMESTAPDFGWSSGRRGRGSAVVPPLPTRRKFNLARFVITTCTTCALKQAPHCNDKKGRQTLWLR